MVETALYNSWIYYICSDLFIIISKVWLLLCRERMTFSPQFEGDAMVWRFRNKASDVGSGWTGQKKLEHKVTWYSTLLKNCDIYILVRVGYS